MYACRHYGRSLAVQPDHVKGLGVCGIVYWDMHYKDLLESNVRLGYCILVPDFYLVLHGLRLGLGCHVLCLRHGIPLWQHIGQSTTATIKNRRDMTSDVKKQPFSKLTNVVLNAKKAL